MAIQVGHNKRMSFAANTSHRIKGDPKGPPIDIEDIASVIERLHYDVHENPATGYREYGVIVPLARLVQENTNLSTFNLSEHVEKTIERFSHDLLELEADATLSPLVKVMVMSIAVPVTRHALLDENYLVDGHSAGLRFIEALKQISSLLQPAASADKDIFYKKLVYLIDEVNDQHTKDHGIFLKAIDKLQKMVEAEKKRRALLEQRAHEMDEAKARLEAAHSRMRAAIAVRTYKKDIPKITRDFIDREWEAVLFFHFNKNEESRSAEFNRALHDLEILIDASQGKRVDLKTLFEALDRDMALLGYPKAERVESLRRLLAEIKERQRGAPTGVTSSHPVITAAEIARITGAPPPADPPPPPPIRDVDPSAAASIPSPSRNPEPGSMQDDFDYLAAECRPNTLFRWQPTPAAEKQAVKLAAIIKSTGDHIFVDRLGSKVMSINKKELAQLLRSGTLVIIQMPQHFDKALEALIQSTRKD